MEHGLRRVRCFHRGLVELEGERRPRQVEKRTLVLVGIR
jgi:hypothetical protein